MVKRTLQGVATVATLGTGMILGALMLSPTSAEPLVDDPGSTGSSAADSSAHSEGVVIAGGSLDDGCATLIPGIELPPGFDYENPPGVFIGTEIDGEMAFRVPTDDELSEFSPLPNGAEFPFLDDLAGHGCIVAGCSVLSLDQALPDGAPTPPLGLPTTEISVTEKNGRVVVTDPDGTVLFETDVPENGALGFEIEDGSVRQIDEANPPSLSGFESQSAGVSTEGCAPLG